MSWSSSSTASPLASCAAASVSAAPGTTPSQTPSTVRSYPRLLLDSSMHLEGKCHFTSATREYPSLSLLPFPTQDVVVPDCYSGLILCWCFGCHYVVCKWLLLPDSLCSCGEARLGLDPIVSSHFHVFEYGKMRKGESIGVSI
jgi:hypothetical protein